MQYLMTFHTHLGALLLGRKLKEVGERYDMMPTPRVLGSNCGTCVIFDTEKNTKVYYGQDADCIYKLQDNKYIEIYCE